MTFDRACPYNALPALPPAVELETTAVLKAAIGANRALAQLKVAGELIPNQAVLLRVLSLQEAKLSSEIENIVTTNDELYRAFSDETGRTDPRTKEVLHYEEALWYGHQQLKDGRALGTNLFEELAVIIKGSQVGVRRVPGTRITNSLGETVYTPPEGADLIRDKLADLERFIYAEDDLDPLVKLAVIHYQFEAIHPFPDGNGRTGRILNILYLIERGLLDLPALYLSRYIIEHKNAYYDGLRGVTERGAWEAWVLYVLGAVAETAQGTYGRIRAVQQLMDETARQVRSELPRVYSRDLIELLFRQPYTKIRFLEEAGLGTRKTVSGYLQALDRIGVLNGVRVGKEIYYVNTRFYELLTR